MKLILFCLILSGCTSFDRCLREGDEELLQNQSDQLREVRSQFVGGLITADAFAVLVGGAVEETDANRITVISTCRMMEGRR